MSPTTSSASSAPSSASQSPSDRRPGTISTSGAGTVGGRDRSARDFAWATRSREAIFCSGDRRGGGFQGVAAAARESSAGPGRARGGRGGGAAGRDTHSQHGRRCLQGEAASSERCCGGNRRPPSRGGSLRGPRCSRGEAGPGGSCWALGRTPTARRAEPHRCRRRAEPAASSARRGASLLRPPRRRLGNGQARRRADVIARAVAMTAGKRRGRSGGWRGWRSAGAQVGGPAGPPPAEAERDTAWARARGGPKALRPACRSGGGRGRGEGP